MGKRAQVLAAACLAAFAGCLSVLGDFVEGTGTTSTGTTSGGAGGAGATSGTTSTSKVCDATQCLGLFDAGCGAVELDGCGGWGGWSSWGECITEDDCDKPPRWVLVDPAVFPMGASCPLPEGGGAPAPALAQVTRPFWLMKEELTVKDLDGSGGSGGGQHCGLCPARYLSWCEAVELANRLSTRAKRTKCYTFTFKGDGGAAPAEDSSEWVLGGCPDASVHCIGPVPKEFLDTLKSVELDPACTGFRLPTEAEWELAARAGSNGPWQGGSDVDLAMLAVFAGDKACVCDGGACDPPCIGGQRTAHACLSDMLGNVAEWVFDKSPGCGCDPGVDAGAMQPFDRLTSGGSYEDDAGVVRVDVRQNAVAARRYRTVGIRFASWFDPPPDLPD